MISFRKILTSAVFAFVTVSVFAGSAGASECQAFPKLKLWGNFTHERVKNMVATRLEGDWDSYLGRLDARLRTIKDMQINDQELVLTYKGKRYGIKGGKLALYVHASKVRRDVVECLAEEAVAENLENFATAAGQEEPTVVETAAIPAVDLKLDVASRCTDGDSIFTITNRGKAWPNLGSIGIYRINDGQSQKINARRMRFDAGQSASLKIKAAQNTTGRLGVFVDPSWGERKFSFDATLACS